MSSITPERARDLVASGCVERAHTAAALEHDAVAAGADLADHGRRDVPGGQRGGDGVQLAGGAPTRRAPDAISASGSRSRAAHTAAVSGSTGMRSANTRSP